MSSGVVLRFLIWDEFLLSIFIVLEIFVYDDLNEDVLILIIRVWL